MADALEPVDADDDAPPFEADAVPVKRPFNPALRAFSPETQANYDAMRSQIGAELDAVGHTSTVKSVTTLMESELGEEYRRDPDRCKREFLGVAMPKVMLATLAAAAGEAPFTKPQRWANQAILNIAKWTGAASEVRAVLELAQEYGLKSEAELRQRLELATRVRDVNLETAQARATELLRRIIAADPSRRATIRTELFGEMDATPDPVAKLPAKAAPVKRGRGRPLNSANAKPTDGYVYDPTVSRQTDYLRRKRAGLVGPPGRPRKNREA